MSQTLDGGAVLQKRLRVTSSFRFALLGSAGRLDWTGSGSGWQSSS